MIECGQCDRVAEIYSEGFGNAKHHHVSSSDRGRLMHFDFLIPRRPVSMQTRNRANLQAWKDYVRGEAQNGGLGRAMLGKAFS
jgi:hypothetical protein